MIVLQSTIICPRCGHRQTETMPTSACRFFHGCKGCGALLRPKPGDCCVYCSFGSVACPPMQQARDGRNEGACCTGPVVDG